MRQSLPSLILTLFTLTLVVASLPTNARSDVRDIKLPTGFKIEIYADSNTKGGESLAGARFMAFDASGNLYVSSAKTNKVLLLPNANKDGVADEVITLADNLNAPQGMAFVGDALLVANQDGIVKLEKSTGFGIADKAPIKTSAFINGLPAGGHTLKNIKLSPDGYLFINVGSSCNVCVESDANRATILRYTTQGKPAGALLTLGRHQQSAIWARGLRNSQGFAWHPKTGDMYATNEGADMRSDVKGGAVNDELPPEHLNKIEAGKHYGWPHCWANPNNEKVQMMDPNFATEAEFCKTAQAPEIIFTSHSTPIGMTFLDKTNWPADYQQDAIVALHGSWNRKQPSGYKLVRVRFKDNQANVIEDFATGWLQGGNAWGRPVDVIVGVDHALYVSDDKAGAIYRITH